MSDALQRARLSLEGLSIGDALGDRFIWGYAQSPEMLLHRALPNPPWPFTDDTNMALSIFDVLRQRQVIDQDMLIESFATHYSPTRGYGAAMPGLFQQVREGVPWNVAATGLFNGQGSYGNGAAMRIAPLGAYFADDLAAVVENARRAAEVTHAHPEGIVGGIAVAVAASYAWQLREEPLTARDFITQVMQHVPESELKQGLQTAVDLPDGTLAIQAAVMLGSGQRVTAMDTVPYVIWCAANFLHDYEEAFWQTAIGLGDIDTTCAMVGGIVALAVGDIPTEWQQHREPLPDWPFG